MIIRYCTVILLCLFYIFPVSSQQNNPLYADSPGPVHWLFNDTNIYDITGNWSNLAPLQDSLFGVNAYYWSVIDKVFICGGAKSPLVPQAKCWWYNPNSNTYESAADLPQGRWSGKLVRVRDSLFLIGSVDSTFNTADGLIFRYSLNQNNWIISDTMPLPYVHESAVSTINDSLILLVGGSTNAFLNPTNTVRLYNPWNRSWRLSTPYPVNLTAAHSDYQSKDTVIVLGGYSGGNLDIVYRGFILDITSDTVLISWSEFGISGATPFGQGVYRVAGARWNDFLLFGPAMNGGATINQIWGLKTNGDTTWFNFTPRSVDSAGNIATYGVKSGADSNYFFLFGGFRNPYVLPIALKYTFATPPPIGIEPTTGILPVSFRLYQNYPNPFNPVTKIRFDLPAVNENNRSNVFLEVYDLLGRKIKTIVNSNLKPGTYEVEFDGANISSGIYFYILRSGQYISSSKMVLLK